MKFFTFTFITLLTTSVLAQKRVEVGDTIEISKQVRKELIGGFVDGEVIRDDNGLKFLVLSKVQNDSDIMKEVQSIDQKSSKNFITEILADSVIINDHVIMHNGNVLTGTVTEITETSVKFKYDDEDLVSAISKNVIADIVFKSRRVQHINDKIVVLNQNDWQRVQITNLESDVVGLTKNGEFMAKANSVSNMKNQGKMEKRAMDRLKMDAAANGCHIVLLLTTTGRNGTSDGWSGGTKASVTGVAYKY